MKKLQSLTILLFIILLTIGCKKNDLKSVTPEKELEKKLQTFLKTNGISNQGIIETPDYYIAEGDIRISKTELKKLSSTVARQAHTNNTVQGGFTDISIRFDASIPYNSRWYSAVVGAIQEWNNVSDCRVNFSITSQPTADITIFQSDLGEGGYGQGSWPMANGKPGSSIYLTNRTQLRQSYPYGPFVTLTYERDLHTAIHELGHCIGLRHTDWSVNESAGSVGANHIPGTNWSDDNSVMNSGNHALSWLKEYSGLSLFDIYAVQYLYPGTPQPSITSGEVYNIVSALDENYKLGVYSHTYSPLSPNGGNSVLTYNTLTSTGYYAGYYHSWTLTGSDNNYSIKFYNSDYGLKVSGSNTPVLSNNYNDGLTWNFTSTGDGYYTIGDPGSGLKLTAPSGTAGNQLQLATSSNGLNQKWKIVPVFPVNDSAKYVTMTIIPDGFTGDIVFTNNTTLEQYTVSNIVPGVPQTIFIKTPNTSYHTYKATFTNSSQTSTTYVSLHNRGGGANLYFTGLQYTTNASNGYPQDYVLWTKGGPYVLKISKNGFIDNYENP